MRLLLAGLLLLGCVASATIAPAAAQAPKDRTPWADADPARKRWFESRTLNEATRQRLGVSYRSCCDAGDVVKNLRWRVLADGSRHGAERWQYRDERTGAWTTIHPDIVQEEASPDEAPILFRNKNDGRELCFFPPRGGI